MSPLAPNPAWHILLSIMFSTCGQHPTKNISFPKILALLAKRPFTFPFWVKALSPTNPETSVISCSFFYNMVIYIRVVFSHFLLGCLQGHKLLACSLLDTRSEHPLCASLLFLCGKTPFWQFHCCLTISVSVLRKQILSPLACV